VEPEEQPSRPCADVQEVPFGAVGRYVLSQQAIVVLKDETPADPVVKHCTGPGDALWMDPLEQMPPQGQGSLSSSNGDL